MKQKLFSIASLCMLSFISYAQLSVGVQAGASMSVPNFSTLPNAKNVTFIQPGIIVDYRLGGLLSIRPSLNYLKSGFTTESITNIGSDVYSTIQKFRTDNILVPIDLCVPIKVGSGKVILSAGPTLVFGLGGNSETVSSKNSVATTTINTPIKFGSNAGEFKQINWGTNFGLGYSFGNGLDIRGIYNLALDDLQNGLPSGTTAKTNVVSLMLAYYFIKPKK
jgi:Outer membrane protein beta-barrel domain